MPRASVEDILRASMRDVDAISKVTSQGAKARRELLDELREADRRLASRLRSEARRFGELDARFTGASALAYQSQIQLQIAYLEKRLKGFTEARARVAVERSLQHTVTAMEQLEKRFTGIVRPLRLRQRGAMSSLIAGNQSSLLGQIPTSVDRYGRAMTAEFERYMRIGMIQGMTMDEMIAGLTGHGGPRGRVSMAARLTDTGVIRLVEEDIPEGLFKRHRYWAERVVRTEMMHSYNQARRVGYESMRDTDAPDLQKKIVAILDNRTAPDSIAVNGQIRNLEDDFVDGKGRRYKYPPARPNDRETTIPWRPEWDEEADKMDSEMDRALLGKLSKKEEDALIEKLKKGRSKPPALRPKMEPKPRSQVRPARERMLAEYRKDLAWNQFNELTFSGKTKGWMYPTAGGWMPIYGDVELSASPLARDEAKRMVDGKALHELENALELTALRASKAKLKSALERSDGVEIRRQARALLRASGVLPRSPGRDAKGAAKVTPKSLPRGVEATHRLGSGEVFVRAGATKRYARKLAKGDTSGVVVMVHEELHGATPYASSSFYRGAGAVIEEVTVETAARKIVSKAYKKRAGYGAYQDKIDEVGAILSDELKPKKAMADVLGDAGIAMRKPGVRPQGIRNEDDILELFLDALGVKEKRKRARILARLKELRFSK